MDVDATPQPSAIALQRSDEQTIALAWNTSVCEILSDITNWPIQMQSEHQPVFNTNLYKFLVAIFRQWPLENHVDKNALPEVQQIQLERWSSHVATVIKKALYIYAIQNKKQ